MGSSASKSTVTGTTSPIPDELLSYSLVTPLVLESNNVNLPEQCEPVKREIAGGSYALRRAESGDSTSSWSGFIDRTGGSNGAQVYESKSFERERYMEGNDTTVTQKEWDAVYEENSFTSREIAGGNLKHLLERYPVPFNFEPSEDSRSFTEKLNSINFEQIHCDFDTTPEAVKKATPAAKKATPAFKKTTQEVEKAIEVQQEVQLSKETKEKFEIYLSGWSAGDDVNAAMQNLRNVFKEMLIDFMDDEFLTQWEEFYQLTSTTNHFGNVVERYNNLKPMFEFEKLLKRTPNMWITGGDAECSRKKISTFLGMVIPGTTNSWQHIFSRDQFKSLADKIGEHMRRRRRLHTMARLVQGMRN